MTLNGMLVLLPRMFLLATAAAADYIQATTVGACKSRACSAV
jgi:hypothetical protein